MQKGDSVTEPEPVPLVQKDGSISVTEPEPVPLVQKDGSNSVTESEPVPLVEREGSNSVTESEVCIANLYQGDISIGPIGVGQN